MPFQQVNRPFFTASIHGVDKIGWEVQEGPGCVGGGARRIGGNEEKCREVWKPATTMHPMSNDRKAVRDPYHEAVLR